MDHLAYSSSNHVSKKVIFLKHFDRHRRKLLLRIHRPIGGPIEPRVFSDQLFEAFFNLLKIVIRQRGPELVPFCVRRPLLSSRPLTDREIVVFAIGIDSCLVVIHSFSCFVEFRSKMVIHFVAFSNS